jgi:hypothetical protein
MRSKFEIRNKKGNVKVIKEAYDTHLLTTYNGYQWSGTMIDRKLAKEIIGVLVNYLDSDKDKNNG